MTEIKRAKRRDAGLYGLLCLASALPYLSTLWNGFVYDDHFQVLGNPYLQSFRFVKQIFTTSVWSFQNTKAITNFYRPVMSLQYLLIYQAYGPLAYVFHLANVILHVAVVALLFALTRRLFQSERLAFWSAILFAVHPVHTEVVAWVAAVPDLQLTLFLLAAMWFYLNLGESQKRKLWTPAATWTFYVLALLSKEPAVMFPAFATAYEHLFRADRTTTTFAQKAGRYTPLWLLTITYLFLRVQFMGRLVPNALRAQLPWSTTILSSFSLLSQYMNKLVWPTSLSIYHPFVPSTSPLDPSVLSGVAWALGLAAIFMILWKQKNSLSMGVVWILVLLAPALNARWMPRSAFAERYLYLPSIGFCWLGAGGLLMLWDAGAARRRIWIRFAVATAVTIVAALSVVRIVTRDADWQNDLIFYKVAVAQNPNNATLHSNLGYAYWEARKPYNAIAEWNLALSYDPEDVIALDNEGMVAIEGKRYAEAIPYLQRALASHPAFTESHLKLARALAGLGRNSEAEGEFRKAIEISPLDWNVHNQAAMFYEKSGRIDDALQEYQASLNAIANSVAFDGQGDIYVQRGQASLAETSFRQAIELDSYDHHAHYQLVLIYGRSGRGAQALREYELAQRTDPGSDTLGQVAKRVVEEIQRNNKH